MSQFNTYLNLTLCFFVVFIYSFCKWNMGVLARMIIPVADTETGGNPKILVTEI